MFERGGCRLFAAPLPQLALEARQQESQAPASAGADVEPLLLLLLTLLDGAGDPARAVFAALAHHCTSERQPRVRRIWRQLGQSLEQLVLVLLGSGEHRLQGIADGLGALLDHDSSAYSG